ncbi:extracellular solute-binding protein [Paenibacillus sp. LHD-117]|uniref:extracellular solute-binding protein n=1 Tax=Paenibacillus sp. LHD-117 TaxID=3071412 RepID=UPI0027E038B4|nr:extracellular solute-binding protein [Paenibacillus sp. LHD-117]MDQ6417845.1 extracellular solute-binding protein [Paenibacillus sp. LHD-117]
MRVSNVRKVGLILLNIVLFSSLLSTCANQNSGISQIDEDKTGGIHQEIGLDKYDPPIQVSFVRETSSGLDNLLKDLPGQTLEDNTWSRLYEEILGIQIDYEWTAKGNLYYQKLGVALASGNIPDVVRVNAQQLRLLSNVGLIQDMTEIYEQFATPLTKRILGLEGSAPFDASTIDGKLMAIPETGSSIEGAQFLWIRTDWLENLGMKPPKTMRELLEISKAFTEKDPDQNGMYDTYGLAATQYLWDPVMGLMDFMAGYHAFPNLWLKDESGKLIFGGIQPEVKTALQVLQDMYRNGQIDREFGLKSGDKVKEDVAAGKLGMLYGEQWGSFLVQTSREKNPESEWRSFPIVSATGNPPKVPLRFSTHQFLAVNKDYEHPEAIVKMINLHLEKNWGETAEYEKYYSSPLPIWQLSPVTPYPAKKNLDAYRQLNEARQTGDYSKLDYEAKAIQKNIETYLAGGPGKDSGWGWERTYGPTGAFAILDKYEKNGQLLYENFVGAPTETMIDKESVLHDLQLNAYINIILGRPISEFDQFVTEWKDLGGDKITEEVNDWFSKKNS